MRVLDGDQFLVRIFLGESDKWHHTPLARAILAGRGMSDDRRVDGLSQAGTRALVPTA